jgi:arylsulfatase A-like enzyme
VAIGAYLNGAQPGKGVEPGWDVGPRASGNSGKGKRQGRSRSKARKTQPASAIAQIEETPAEQPLYLHIGFGAPHVPVRPVPPYAGQFDGVQVDRDDLSFNAPDLTGKPRFMRSLSRLKSGEEAWLDRLHQGRLECLLQLDDEIASIWDALEARGRLDNTYVFLLTDNGYLLGQHRYYGKHVPYDGSVRMPLYAFGPGFSPGAVDERLVGNVDIAPTLAEIASVELPLMDGVSLLSNHDRDAILLEFLAPAVNSMKWPGPRAEITRYRGLRTASHLYVEYQTGERELYDRGSDPSETHNLLAGAPPAEIEELAGSLSIRLAELRTCRGAVCL